MQPLSSTAEQEVKSGGPTAPNAELKHDDQLAASDLSEDALAEELARKLRELGHG